MSKHNRKPSRNAILAFEEREAFEALVADLRTELQPIGRLEEEIVFELAHIRWQKRRMLRMWRAAAV